jgi:PAS domain S-box-containing protein
MISALLKRFDFRVSAAYALVAFLWIVLSDEVLERAIGGNESLLVGIGTLKGLAFVLVTTLALFAVLHNELRKRDEVERTLELDVRERTQTLGMLRQTEHRFAAIFHSSPVPTNISRSEDGRIVDVNAAYEELTGYKREDLIGRKTTEVGLWLHPEKRAEIVKAISETGSLRNFELQGRSKSGATLHLLVSSQLIDLGNEPHLVSMFYDVTEHRKLEAQIRYQALLLENVSDAVISTDMELNIRSWNPSAEAIYSWKADEVIGKSTAELLGSEYSGTTRAEVLNQLQTTGLWRGELTQRRKDDSRVYLLASTSYVHDSDGNRVGIVSVNRDITELTKAQQERQAAELLRLELEQQAELLRLKEDFISVVSHEFRTPLSVIISSGELVHNYSDRMPLERQLKHVEVVLAQAHFMTDLLDDVLTINKARAGKLEFNPAPLNLIAFVEETLERIEVLDQGKHQFAFTHEGDLSAVRMDVKLLQHILVNLLSNAVKYSPDGGDVYFEVKRQNGEVVFRVSDQGIGIPADSLPHLYEPFYRANNTGEIGGTGLGLPIVKESVVRHGGTIACETEVNIGTTFTVTLPVSAPQ